MSDYIAAVEDALTVADLQVEWSYWLGDEHTFTIGAGADGALSLIWSAKSGWFLRWFPQWIIPGHTVAHRLTVDSDPATVTGEALRALAERAGARQ